MQWRLQPDVVDGTKVNRLSSEGKSPNSRLICLHVPVTLYSMLGFERSNVWTTVIGSKKTMSGNKDNSCSSLHVQLTVCIHLTIQ